MVNRFVEFQRSGAWGKFLADVQSFVSDNVAICVRGILRILYWPINMNKVWN